MSTITRDQVEHIAKLARIELTEAEKEKMTKELGAILTYVEKLNEVDTTGVEPTSAGLPRTERSSGTGVTGLEDVFRKDEVMDWWGGNPFDLVEAAPKKEGRFVKVKEVFGT